MRSFFLSLILLSCHNPLYAATAALLQTSNGEISFSSLKGKWVFINYWASWCHPCLDEIPVLNRFYAAHRNEPIALFAVNYDGFSKKEQRDLTQQFHIKYPRIEEDPATMLKLGDIRNLPTTFVFNPKGKLHDVLYGGQTIKSLNAYYQTLKQGSA
jgi:thiol-disulfide isomerase/thioredoxin